MYEIKKNGKIFTSKFVGTGPSSYEKRIYQAAVSQSSSNTGVEDVIRKRLTEHCAVHVPPCSSVKFLNL